MLKFAIAAFATPFIFASTTLADTMLPDIDVEAQCQYEAKISENSKSQYVFCMRRQQAGYDKLKIHWANTPEAIRRTCVAKWNAYDMIEYCRNEEARATEEAATLKFKK